MTKYMENSLTMPLREALKIMQDRILTQSTYFGIRAIKSPNDFWVYQEIIWETKPDVILEIGNFNGGSTLALAHLCDCVGKGKVIGLDIDQHTIPEIVRAHPRITLFEGDAGILLPRIQELISKQDKVLVIEDSSHTYDNTLNVLRLYSAFIKPGDYFIVEDGIINHGLDYKEFKSGPFEAVETFLKENRDFELDRTRESFLITWNPKGYLRRKNS